MSSCKEDGQVSTSSKNDDKEVRLKNDDDLLSMTKQQNCTPTAVEMSNGVRVSKTSSGDNACPKRRVMLERISSEGDKISNHDDNKKKDHHDMVKDFSALKGLIFSKERRFWAPSTTCGNEPYAYGSLQEHTRVPSFKKIDIHQNKQNDLNSDQSKHEELDDLMSRVEKMLNWVKDLQEENIDSQQIDDLVKMLSEIKQFQPVSHLSDHLTQEALKISDQVSVNTELKNHVIRRQRIMELTEDVNQKIYQLESE